MNPFTALSAVEQVAEHLRAELLRGSFSGTMPGVHPLVAELGVNHKTVKAALRILEDEGLLVNQGRGVQRRIALPDDHAPPALRVAVLAFDLVARSERFMVELCHLLEESGHIPFFPDKTLEDLGRNVNRVARYVKKPRRMPGLCVLARAKSWSGSCGRRRRLSLCSESVRDYRSPARRRIRCSPSPR